MEQGGSKNREVTILDLPFDVLTRIFTILLPEASIVSWRTLRKWQDVKSLCLTCTKLWKSFSSVYSTMTEQINLLDPAELYFKPKTMYMAPPSPSVLLQLPFLCIHNLKRVDLNPLVTGEALRKFLIQLSKYGSSNLRQLSIHDGGQLDLTTMKESVAKFNNLQVLNVGNISNAFINCLSYSIPKLFSFSFSVLHAPLFGHLLIAFQKREKLFSNTSNLSFIHMYLNSINDSTGENVAKTNEHREWKDVVHFIVNFLGLPNTIEHMQVLAIQGDQFKERTMELIKYQLGIKFMEHSFTSSTSTASKLLIELDSPHMNQLNSERSIKPYTFLPFASSSLSSSSSSSSSFLTGSSLINYDISKKSLIHRSILVNDLIGAIHEGSIVNYMLNIHLKFSNKSPDTLITNIPYYRSNTVYDDFNESQINTYTSILTSQYFKDVQLLIFETKPAIRIQQPLPKSLVRFICITTGCVLKECHLKRVEIYMDLLTVINYNQLVLFVSACSASNHLHSIVLRSTDENNTWNHSYVNRFLSFVPKFLNLISQFFFKQHKKPVLRSIFIQSCDCTVDSTEEEEAFDIAQIRKIKFALLAIDQVYLVSPNIDLESLRLQVLKCFKGTEEELMRMNV